MDDFDYSAVTNETEMSREPCNGIAHSNRCTLERMASTFIRSSNIVLSYRPSRVCVCVVCGHMHMNLFMNWSVNGCDD